MLKFFLIIPFIFALSVDAHATGSAVDLIAKYDKERSTQMMAEAIESDIYVHSKAISALIGKNVDLNRLANTDERKVMLSAILRTAFLHALPQTITDYIDAAQLTDPRYKTHIIAVLAADAVGRALVNGELDLKENYDGIHTEGFKKRVLTQLTWEAAQETAYKALLGDVKAAIEGDEKYLSDILTDQATAWADEVLFPLQIRRARALAASQHKTGKPIKLVLGAANNERHEPSNDRVVNRFNDPNIKYVFFDIEEDGRNNPWESPYIRGSFNDTELMKTLAMRLAGLFDEVFFDDSVTKFVTWAAPVIKEPIAEVSLIRNMLAKNGFFSLYDYPMRGCGRVIELNPKWKLKTADGTILSDFPTDDQIVENINRWDDELREELRQDLGLFKSFPTPGLQSYGAENSSKLRDLVMPLFQRNHEERIIIDLEKSFGWGKVVARDINLPESGPGLPFRGMTHKRRVIVAQK